MSREAWPTSSFLCAGRLTLRVAWGMPEAYNIIALNDIASEESIAYLIKYDSIHGTWGPNVEYDEAARQVVITDGDRVAKIPITREADLCKVALAPPHPPLCACACAPVRYRICSGLCPALQPRGPGV